MNYILKPLVFISALTASGVSLAGEPVIINLPLPAPYLLLGIGLGLLYLFRPR